MRRPLDSAGSRDAVSFIAASLHPLKNSPHILPSLHYYGYTQTRRRRRPEISETGLQKCQRLLLVTFSQKPCCGIYIYMYIYFLPLAAIFFLSVTSMT